MAPAASLMPGSWRACPSQNLEYLKGRLTAGWYLRVKRRSSHATDQEDMDHQGRTQEDRYHGMPRPGGESCARSS
jgi:hypothetical protein